MKKLVKIFAVLVVLSLLVGAIIACKPDCKGNHTYAEEVTRQATCTEKGEKTLTCSVCGDVTTQEIPALGHSWNEGTITTPAGCETAGVKTFTCTRCNNTKTEDVSATGHNLVWQSNATQHWQKCTNTNCTHETAKEDHTPTDGKCKCGKIDTSFPVTAGATLIASVPNENDVGAAAAFVAGVVKEVNENGFNSAITIVCEDGTEMLMYRVRDEKGAEFAELSKTIAVGDVVVCYGVMRNYEGAAQMSYGQVVQIKAEAKTDLAKLALANVKVLEKTKSNLVLPTTTKVADVDVALTWAVKSGTGVAANGAVTRTAADQTTVLTVTATASATVTAAKDVTIVVPKKVAGQETIEIFPDSLGLVDSYKDGTATVDGVALQWTKLYYKDSGIQWNKKNGSTLWNTAATSGKILKVEINWNTTKHNADRADVITYEFGTSAEFTGVTPANVSINKDNATEVITPPNGDFTFFRITQIHQNVSYINSIVVTYQVACTHQGTTITPHAAVAATCTTAGSIAYWECECGAKFSDQALTTPVTETAVAALGHDFVNADGTLNTQKLVAAVAATCTEKGSVAHYKCARCNHYFKVENNAAVDAGTERSAVETPALDHSWGAWTQVASTPTTHQRVCTRDNTHKETGNCTSEWVTDDPTNHWKACSVCQGKTENGAHSYTNGTCACGKLEVVATALLEGGTAKNCKTLAEAIKYAQENYNESKAVTITLTQSVSEAGFASTTEKPINIVLATGSFTYTATSAIDVAAGSVTITGTLVATVNYNNVAATLALPAGNTVALASGIKCDAAHITIGGTALAHSYGAWTNKDATNHAKTCSLCGDEATEAHNLAWVNTDATQHWKACSGCAYTTEKVAHTHNVPTTNATQHWKACECGHADTKTDHTLTYTKLNDEKHSVSCSGCAYAVAEADHENVNGKCGCGKLYTSLPVETFANVIAAMPSDGSVSEDYFFVVGTVKEFVAKTSGSGFENNQVKIEDENGTILLIYDTQDEKGVSLKVSTDNLPIGTVVAFYGKAKKHNSDNELIYARLVQVGAEAKATAATIMFEKLAVDIPTSVNKNFTLPTSFNKVYKVGDSSVNAVISWKVKSGTGITLDGATAQVTVGSTDQTVILTATALVGAETLEKDFTITVVDNSNHELMVDYATEYPTTAHTKLTKETRGGLVFTYAKGTGSDPQVNSDGYLQLYQKNSLTIAGNNPSYFSILEIKIVYSAVGTTGLTCGEGGQYVVSGLVGIWTPSEGTPVGSVTLSCGDSGAQNKITSIQVRYKCSCTHPSENLTSHAAVTETCTTNGNIAYWECSVCGSLLIEVNGEKTIASTTDIFTNATGHNFVDKQCSNCDVKQVDVTVTYSANGADASAEIPTGISVSWKDENGKAVTSLTDILTGTKLTMTISLPSNCTELEVRKNSVTIGGVTKDNPTTKITVDAAMTITVYVTIDNTTPQEPTVLFKSNISTDTLTPATGTTMATGYTDASDFTLTNDGKSMAFTSYAFTKQASYYRFGGKGALPGVSTKYGGELQTKARVNANVTEISIDVKTIGSTLTSVTLYVYDGVFDTPGTTQAEITAYDTVQILKANITANGTITFSPSTGKTWNNMSFRIGIDKTSNANGGFDITGLTITGIWNN